MTRRCNKRPLDARPFFIERGSTVRVRQSASTKSLQMGLLCCLSWRAPRARYTSPGLAARAGMRDVWCRLATHLIEAMKLRTPKNLPAYGHPPLPCWANSLTPSPVERWSFGPPRLCRTVASLPPERSPRRRDCRWARSPGPSTRCRVLTPVAGERLSLARNERARRECNYRTQSCANSVPQRGWYW
jgi:hypothetical protein